MIYECFKQCYDLNRITSHRVLKLVAFLQELAADSVILNSACTCPRMQKCILRGLNFKNLQAGALLYTLELYFHHLLLKVCCLL